jgi:hypothetical protein
MRPLHSCIAGQIAERIKGRYVVRVGLPTGCQAVRFRFASPFVPGAFDEASPTRVKQGAVNLASANETKTRWVKPCPCFHFLSPRLVRRA